jgi:hypothetical protein
VATTAQIALLDEALENALSTAATLDQQGIIPEHTQELFPDAPPTNVALVQTCLDFYREHQTVMDRAIQGALNLLGSPEGVAKAKALEGSFEAQGHDTVSVQLAADMLRSGEFGFTKAAEVQGLEGFGIGISAGASAIVGVLAGADIVFEKDEVIPRVWVGGSFKGGLSVNGGLELSFWVNEPLTGAIAGWLLDLYIPQVPPLAFIRFMYIKERATGETSFTFSGVSLQFPLGVGFPIRLFIGKKPGLTAVFGAQQQAAPRPRRATLDVVNKSTGVSTIAVQENTALTTTFTNTSGNGVALSAGATMTIDMPSYFAAADVGKMTISLSGWTFLYDSGNNQLTLTLSSAYTWPKNAALSFAIANVQSSNTPPQNQSSLPGVVKLTLNDTSFEIPIVTMASFNLVWKNSEATMNWKANVVGFTLIGPASGTTVGYAQPGNEVVTLTTAKNPSNADVWVLGYVYNYSSDNVPQISAVWWKQGSIKTGSNYMAGPPVTMTGQTSTCTYNPNGSTVAVTPTFG